MRRILAALLLLIPLTVQARGAKSAMDSFRLEIYRDGNSATYYIHKTEEETSLYYRDYGESEGWRLSKTQGNPLEGIEKICKKARLASLPETSFSTEDKSRDRLMIQTTSEKAGGRDIIIYSDSPEYPSDLETRVVSLIHDLLQQMEKSGWKCARSKCIYSPDGQLLRRIDYTPEGAVCGGYDAKDPFATF